MTGTKPAKPTKSIEKIQNFIRIINTTPLTWDDAVTILDEENLNKLKIGMIVIVTSNDIVLPSPLAPNSGLSEAQQKEGSIKIYRTHLHSYSGDYARLIDYIPQEERDQTFSSLCVALTRQFLNSKYQPDITPEKQLKQRADCMNKLREIFKDPLFEPRIQKIDETLALYTMKESKPNL